MGLCWLSTSSACVWPNRSVNTLMKRFTGIFQAHHGSQAWPSRAFGPRGNGFVGRNRLETGALHINILSIQHRNCGAHPVPRCGPLVPDAPRVRFAETLVLDDSTGGAALSG